MKGWIRYAAVAALLMPAGALAQNASSQAASDKRMAEIMANARDVYAVPRKLTRCQENAAPGEIVVCGREENDEDKRVPNNTAQGSTDIGVPHADVGTHPPPGGVTMRGCMLQKCPKPLYLIDLSKIPLPPPGSDADKIAKGEMRAP